MSLWGITPRTPLTLRGSAVPATPLRLHHHLQLLPTTNTSFSSLNHHLHFPPACMELHVHGHLPLHLHFSLFLSNTEPTTCTIIQTAISVTTQTAIRFVFCHHGKRFSEALPPRQCVPAILGRSVQRGFPAPPPQQHQQQPRLEVAG